MYKQDLLNNYLNFNQNYTDVKDLKGNILSDDLSAIYDLFLFILC